MRLAVISDVHGNLEAFEAVLDDIRASKTDMTVCLGDNIGYGPDPEAVVRLMMQEGIPCVLGNHELGIIDPSILEWFNHMARNALVNTKAMLSDTSVRYCHTLPSSMVLDGIRFVHGMPPDDPLAYLFEFDDRKLIRLSESTGLENICFVGHTHMIEICCISADGVDRGYPREQVSRLRRDAAYILNAGSVGQPRDGINKDAKYIIFDSDCYTVEIRFVPYDNELTARKIIGLGWPEYLARRLV